VLEVTGVVVVEVVAGAFGGALDGVEVVAS